MTTTDFTSMGSTSADVLDVLVIGAGQTGLAIGYHLQRAGLNFTVLDAAPRLGEAWHTRWDSLQLFTPAEFCSLPGLPFPAAAGTYPAKDDVGCVPRELRRHVRPAGGAEHRSPATHP